MQVAVVKVLLQIGVDVNARNAHGNTALHRALQFDYDPDGNIGAIIGLLLNNGCYTKDVQQKMQAIIKLK
jgi:ankyrin repeat protein